MLVRVPGSARPPASVDGSVRLWATLLPAAALAMGALAPATRRGRFAIRGLAAVTFAWGALIAVLGARQSSESRRSLALADPPVDPAPSTRPTPAAVTILVPARDEACVIGALVADLGRLHGQPPGVVVIDDGSTDGTGDAARAAMTVAGMHGRLIRRSRGGDGKGRALAHVGIGGDPDAIVVVLDADARVGPGFGDACRAAMAGGVVAASARRRMLRPARPSRATDLLARLQDDEQEIDDVIQRGRLALGGAGELRGNGMVLRADVLAELGGWPLDAVCEDLELSSRLYLNTGHGADRPPGLTVWEQPVVSLRAIVRQRLRWAEGSIRRDLRIVLPTALRGAKPVRRSVEPLAYAGQALVPWLAVGMAARSIGRRGGAARGGLATLLGSYGIASLTIAWTALEATPGQPVRSRVARTLGSAAFAAQWLAFLPIAWLRVALRSGPPRFEQTEHAPAADFSGPEPVPPARM